MPWGDEMTKKQEKKLYAIVDAEALRRILIALNGHGHEIRELQFTRGALFNNPIDTVAADYQAGAKIPDYAATDPVIDEVIAKLPKLIPGYDKHYALRLAQKIMQDASLMEDS